MAEVRALVSGETPYRKTDEVRALVSGELLLPVESFQLAEEVVLAAGPAAEGPGGTRCFCRVTILLIGSLKAIYVAITVIVCWDTVAIGTNEVGWCARAVFLVLATVTVLEVVTHEHVHDTPTIRTQEAFVALTALQLVVAHVAVNNAVTEELLVDAGALEALVLVLGTHRCRGGAGIFVVAQVTVIIAITEVVLDDAHGAVLALVEALGARRTISLITSVDTVVFSVTEVAGGDTQVLTSTLEG